MAFYLSSSDSRRLAQLAKSLGLSSKEELVSQAIGLFEQIAAAKKDGADILLRYPDKSEFSLTLVSSPEDKAA